MVTEKKRVVAVETDCTYFDRDGCTRVKKQCSLNRFYGVLGYLLVKKGFQQIQRVKSHNLRPVIQLKTR